LIEYALAERTDERCGRQAFFRHPGVTLVASLQREAARDRLVRGDKRLNSLPQRKPQPGASNGTSKSSEPKEDHRKSERDRREPEEDPAQPAGDSEQSKEDHFESAQDSQKVASTNFFIIPRGSQLELSGSRPRSVE
jgi:hypothetical protein